MITISRTKTELELMENPENKTSITLTQPICKNCRWWEYESICDFPFTIQGEDAYQNGHGAEIEADALDDSGLEVFFRTGPNFGCVNFTPA